MKLALLLIILCSTICFADPATTRKSTQPPLPPKGIKVERDLQYVPGGDPAQALDLYLPEQTSDKPLPLIVWIHGGGWWGGSKAGCPAVALVRQGYAAASVEYRFSRKAVFPAQIQDCQAAIRWLRANSKKYHLDPDRIGVWGGSAGGHLVALLGTAGGKNAFPPLGGNEDQSDRVQAVVDQFGAANFNSVMRQAAKDKMNDGYNLSTGGAGSPYAVLIGVQRLGEDKAREDAASPVHYVSTDNPPFLIHHGTVDRSVPFAQSVELYDALQKAGVEAMLQTFPNVGHGGAIFDANPPVTRQISTFFDKYLKQMDVKIEPLFNSFRATPPKPGR